MLSKLPRGHITKSTIVIISAGAAGFTISQLLCGSERLYTQVVMPIAHSFLSDGETAHRWAVLAAKYNLLPRFGWNRIEYDHLRTNVFGLEFRNPIGLAAGFDKDAEALDGLVTLSGFGFVEVGSVTPLPQPGNPKPRVFRLIEDRAVINRYGFNSVGHGPVMERLKRFYRSYSGPVRLGVNLGKNKESLEARLDYEIGVSHLGPYCHYLVVNVSSPNTPGLRSLQSRRELEKLLKTVKSAVDRLDVDKSKRPKVLLKVAPDLLPEERRDIAMVSLDSAMGVDGLIVSNTTIQRPDCLKSDLKTAIGGLSGGPLKNLSTESVRDFYRLTKGKVPIIGCGGVQSGVDAYEKIRAGASLVQLYTAIVYDGFPVVGKVKRELAELLKNDGFGSVSDAVGADHLNNPP